MIKKVRFIEPCGCIHYKKSITNIFTYNKYICNPSTGLIILATIVKNVVEDTLMYSEAIGDIDFGDVLDSDIVFIGINTFSAIRGYQIAKQIKETSKALVVMGGLHATLNYSETAQHVIMFCEARRRII